MKKLKNDKYFVGQYTNPGEFKGWLVGSFYAKNHPCRTKKVEILYREYKAGDTAKPHYHQKKIEFVIMLEGKAKYTINGKEIILHKGDFYFADINNIIAAEFLEPSKIIGVHSPSIPSDKTIVEE